MEKRSFFVSYAGADRVWGEWIAWQLEEAGYPVFIQAWDFVPGENFVERMHDALEKAERTIALISPAYLASPYCREEWTSAFLRDSEGRSRLLPIRIEECEMPRLLRTQVYLDLQGLTAPQARSRLLDGVKSQRRKPRSQPDHPMAAGSRKVVPSFPGGTPRITNIPPRLVTFSGRSDQLRQLRGMLDTASNAAIVPAATVHGLGGVGKTQLAIEYAHMYGSNYDIVWWIPSELLVAIPEALFALSRKLGMPEERNQSEMLSELWNELRMRGRWLLIYDNAENVRSLVPYRPPSGNGHILITSQTPSWGGAPTLGLGALRQEEALAFLCARVGDEDMEVLSSLSATLGHLPLALEQAASYLDETKVGPAEYLQMFHEHGAELLAVESTMSEKTVSATWRVALDRVRHRMPAAQDLLILCSFLHAEDIPKDLLTNAEGLPAELRTSFSRSFEFNQLLATVHRYSLIQLSASFLSIHRLMQTVVRSGLSEDEAKQWAARAVVLVNATFPSGGSDAARWQRCSLLLPHALAAIDNAREVGAESVTVALLLNKVATFLWGRADLPQARRLLEQSLALERQYHGDDLAIAGRLNDLGLVLWDMGRLDEGRAAHEHALEIRRSRLAPDHPDLAMSLTNLGAVLCDLEEFDEARDVLRQALTIWGGTSGRAASLAVCLSNLGVAFYGLGELAEARRVLEASLDAWNGRTAAIAADADSQADAVADELGHLAGQRAYRERELRVPVAPPRRKRWTHGTPLWRWTRSLRRKASSTVQSVEAARRQAVDWARSDGQHAVAATIMDNLGTVIAHSGDLDEAWRLLLQGLGIRQSQLGDEHPDVAWSLNNLAVVIADMGQADDALVLLEEVMTIREAKLGRDHPDVATSLSNLASVLADNGDLAGAVVALRQSQKIREEALSWNHAAAERIRSRLLALERVAGSSVPSE